MKQKRELAVLVILVVIAGITWFRYFGREKPEEGTGAVVVAQNNNQLLSVENPQLHLDKLEAARKTEYKSTGRNIFITFVPPPPPPKDRDKEAPKPIPGPMPDPIPPPPAIPANIHFFGYGTVPNGTSRRAFFTDGEEVYVVGEGDIFLNRFRILRIGNATLEFEEISSGRQGTVPLEEQAASSSP
jgi:hypothetical protein